MINFIPEKSTITTPGVLYCANQPLIMTWSNTDSTVNRMQITVNNITVTSFRNEENYFAFNITDIIRSWFKHKTEIKNNYIINYSIYQKAEITIPSKEVRYFYFINSLINVKEKVIFTDFDTININTNYDLYFANKGSYWIKQGRMWNSFNQLPDDKVIGIATTRIQQGLMVNPYFVRFVNQGDDVQYLDFNDPDRGQFSTWRIDIEHFEVRGYTVNPAIVLYNGDSFEPDSYGDVKLLPKGTTTFTLNDDYPSFAIIWDDWSHINNCIITEGTMTYENSGQIILDSITIYRDNDVELKHIGDLVYTTCTKLSDYVLRWVNQFGGYDYYDFDKVIYNKQLKSTDTITVSKNDILQNPTVEYNKKIEEFTLIKSKTELMNIWKSLSFIPFSTIIEKLTDRGWERVYVEEYETSFRPVDKAGSIELEIQENQQYGLSYV